MQKRKGPRARGQGCIGAGGCRLDDALLEDPGEAADIARLEGQKMCAGRIHPRRTVLVGEPQYGLGLAQVA